jgi:hypothetical protein
MSKRRMPLGVWFGGPVAFAAYHVTTWLLENEPDHWLIRGLTKAADWISDRLPK